VRLPNRRNGTILQDVWYSECRSDTKRRRCLLFLQLTCKSDVVVRKCKCKCKFEAGSSTKPARDFFDAPLVQVVAAFSKWTPRPAFPLARPFEVSNTAFEVTAMIVSLASRFERCL
jgi:hypothetical protein